MNKRKAVATWIIIALLAIGASGCALLNTAVSAGIAYGVYKATSK